MLRLFNRSAAARRGKEVPSRGVPAQGEDGRAPRRGVAKVDVFDNDELHNIWVALQNDRRVSWGRPALIVPCDTYSYYLIDRRLEIDRLIDKVRRLKDAAKEER